MTHIRTLLTTAGACVLLVAQSPAQDDFPADRSAYLQAMQGSEPDKRVAAVQAFGGCGDPRAVDLMLDHIRKGARLRRALEEELAKLGRKLDAERERRLGPYAGKSTMPADRARMVEKALAPIREEITKLEERLAGEEAVREALAQALGTLVGSLEGEERARALEDILKTLDRARKAPWRAELVNALGRVPAEAARSALKESVFRDEAAAVRVAALEALADGTSGDSEGTALHALEDDSWQVRAAALDLLRKVGSKESIKPLIERLEAEEGRLVDEVIGTLAHLTKVNFHANATLWRRWWSENQGVFQGRGAEAGVPGAAAASGKPGRNPGDEGGGTYFFGIRTRSKHIIYVLDLSGSMNWSLDADVPPSAHQGQGPLPPDAPKGERKLDDALEQLVGSVVALPEDATFNIVTYGSDTDVYAPKMVPATGRNKKGLKRWAARTSAIGATNIYAALDRAFSIVGRGSFDKHYEVTADTIYFLSDGVPTVGRTTDPEEILRQVQRWNELQNIQVHTVGLGKSIDPEFMRRLAEQTGGRFVHKK